MSVLRGLVAAVAGILVAVTALAFAVERTLNEPDAFTASMTASADTFAVEAEIQEGIRREVRDALDRAGTAGPVGAIIAAIGAETIADRAAEATGTDVFRAAWRDWSLLLFTGLADHARGQDNPDVAVAGRDVTIGVAPLVAPLVGDTISGGLTSALALFDADSTATIDTGVPIARGLVAAGRFAEWRWALLAVTAGWLLLVLAGRRPAGWLAVALLWAAAVCAAAGGLLLVAQTQPVPRTQYPEVGRAVVTALTDSWDDLLFAVAAGCAALGLLSLLVDALFRPRRVRSTAAPAAPSA